jgi:hypothetical protein
LRYGIDPGPVCCAYIALPLWTLGYPDQALHKIREALTLAQKLGHPFTLGYVRLITSIA